MSTAALSKFTKSSTSILYGQDGAVGIAGHFVSAVPRHVGRGVNVSMAMQA